MRRCRLMSVRVVAVLRPCVLALACVALVAIALAAVPAEEFEAVAATAREHRLALGRLLALQEQQLGRATDDVARLRALHARELIARLDVEHAQRRHAALGAEVAKTRTEASRVDAVIADALASAALARLPRMAPGEERHAPDLLAFGGRGGWSLSRVPAVERFFSGRFGRPLPVSALGQTAIHERLGLDHRHALDVAIHPDTVEGRALVAYLKAEGIPFIAFRGAALGVSTGAHVHIGEPSVRSGGPRKGPFDRRGGLEGPPPPPNARRSLGNPGPVSTAGRSSASRVDSLPSPDARPR